MHWHDLSNCKTCLLNLMHNQSGYLVALERNTFLVFPFLFSMFNVPLSCWIFKLSALADTVPLLRLWTISCIVQASEHLLTVRIVFVGVCIDLGGKKIPLRLFLDVGIWNLNEWKCICVTSSESVMSHCTSLRKEGWKCNTGVISARFLWAYCQNPAFWAVRRSADSQKQDEIQYALRKETLLCVVLHKCTSGVLVPVEFPYPRGASITAHWKWSAFSSKGELQQEAVGKEEQVSIDN